MFRKIFTAVILAFTAVMLSAQSIKVDHSSQDKILGAYWEAMATRNGDLLWNLVPPKYHKLPKAALMKKGFLNGVFQSFPETLSTQIRTAMKNPDVLKKLIESGKKEFQRNLVQIDGKWYLDFIGQTIESLASAKIPLKPAAVDHSSKTKVLLSFLLGLYYEDDELVWNSMDPNIRGSEKQKKGIAKTAAKTIPRDVLATAIKTLASNEVSLDHIRMNETRCIQINGKWYISPVVKK